MYRMTGFVAARDNVETYEFFFGLSTVESALHGAHLSGDELVEQALQVIKSRLDEGKLINGTQYAYQYDFEVVPLQFKLVDKPVWMTQAPR